MFEPTSAGWPSFMRINPILEWHYHAVWALIQHLDLPFCSLYEKGYTSVGQTFNTFPNPHLLIEDAAGVKRYNPAWFLQDEHSERYGRNPGDHS